MNLITERTTPTDATLSMLSAIELAISNDYQRQSINQMIRILIKEKKEENNAIQKTH
jgi:hypothetical protein